MEKTVGGAEENHLLLCRLSCSEGTKHHCRRNPIVNCWNENAWLVVSGEGGTIGFFRQSVPEKRRRIISAAKKYVAGVVVAHAFSVACKARSNFNIQLLHKIRKLAVAR
jgi:hypothetical protein